MAKADTLSCRAALSAGNSTAGEFPNSCLYEGQVYHKRMRPRQHCLNYRVFSLLADIDSLSELASSCWCLSLNRLNLFSIFEKDFGDSSERDLRSYVERKLASAGLFSEPCKIMLLAYPRVLGYAFNPLSVYYCYDEGARLYAVLYEVHNTFGERHTYVLPVDLRDGRATHGCTKQLHVSPFAPMQMDYSFLINPPNESISVTIHVTDSAGLMISAAFSGRHSALVNRRLVLNFFKYPMMTVKVIGAIHWEALLLWKKGVPWFTHRKSSG